MIRRLVGNRYQILDKIGEGGAAEVFRAMDTRLERLVALKVLRESYALDAAFTQRFENEARAAARLSHPAIVDIYDYHREDGRYIISFEYVPGRSLKQYLAERAPLSEDESRRIASRVLEALAVAHDAGIVHRDVNPQNVLITPDGEVKITDFGIAKVLEDAGITQGAPQLGTPHYLSPEQAFGEQVTPRADLYGVGVMLYEMLSGRLPFEGGSAMKIAYGHLFDPPPPLREVATGVSEEIARVVERALAKDPAERWASAAEMRAALAAVPVREERPAPPPAPAVVSRSPATRPGPRPAPEPRPAGKRSTRWPRVLLVGLPLAIVLAGLVALALRGDGRGGDRTAVTVGDGREARNAALETSDVPRGPTGGPGRDPSTAPTAEPRSRATERAAVTAPERRATRTVAGRITPAAGEEAAVLYVATTGFRDAHLRAAADMAATILVDIPYGTRLIGTPVRTRNGQRWYRVTHGGREGFVRADLLSDAEPSPIAEAPADRTRAPETAPTAEPAPPEATVDRRRERRLVFEDEDFQGGVPVQDSLGRGTTVKRLFSRESGFAVIRVRFGIEGTPVGDDAGNASLGITGTDSRAVQAGAPAPRVSIAVNGRTISTGASPFREAASRRGAGGWRIAAVSFPASLLRSGENVVTIENLSPEGGPASPPWLMLLRAALVYYEV